MKRKVNILELIKLGGIPGYILLGYYAIMLTVSRTKSEITAIDSSAIISALYSLGGGYYSLLYLKQRTERKHLFYLLIKKTPLKWFIIYTIICGLSSLWSVNMAISAYRTVECLGILVLMIATVETLYEKTNTEGVLKWSAVYATITVVTKFVSSFPPLAAALYSCQMPATIFFYLAFMYAPIWYCKWPLIVIALFCKSTTGYMGIALGLCSFFYGRAKYKIFGIIIMLGISIAILVVGVDSFLNNTIFASKGGVLENGEILSSKTSGRDILWENALDKIKNDGKQLYGYGFVAGEMIIVRDIIGNQVIGMHNGYLSAYIGTGVIGLIFFILFMLNYAIIAFGKNIPKSKKQIIIALMYAVMIHTFANPGLGTRVYATWIPAMFVVVITCNIYLRCKLKIER